jgi:hypothetical protein
LVGAGVLAPLVRKRLAARPIVTQAVALGAPLGLAVAVRRSWKRDVAVSFLHMWAYLAAYKIPHDDPGAQERRLRIDYPIVIDRLLGLGEVPTVRLQRARLKGAAWRPLDHVLVWTHWTWFAVPHVSLAYILWRDRERFPRAAVMTYAVFDLGAIFYWVIPTAPPWYAAIYASGLDGGAIERAALREPLTGEAVRPQRGLRSDPPVRRLMDEYGEYFWGDHWTRLYSVLGGNPLAAMPSLHFATSVMAALLLRELGPVPGAIGWGYALTLGFALVYLGEHYLADLLGGVLLTAAVRRLGPRAGPALQRAARAIAALEREAHEAR